MSEMLVRQPLLRKKPGGKFVMHDFQREDLTQAYRAGSVLLTSVRWER